MSAIAFAVVGKSALLVLATFPRDKGAFAVVGKSASLVLAVSRREKDATALEINCVALDKNCLIDTGGTGNVVALLAIAGAVESA